jgi:hypothetical protein
VEVRAQAVKEIAVGIARALVGAQGAAVVVLQPWAQTVCVMERRQAGAEGQAVQEPKAASRALASLALAAAAVEVAVCLAPLV